MNRYFCGTPGQTYITCNKSDVQEMKTPLVFFSFDLCSISSVTMTRTLLYFYQMLVLQFLVI